MLRRSGSVDSLIQFDMVVREGAYVDPEAVVAIVPRRDDDGCWLMLKGGQQIIFLGSVDQAYRQLFDRENICSSQCGSL